MRSQYNNALQQRNSMGFLVGTVQSVSGSALTVLIDGNATAIAAIASYSNPAVGNRVTVMQIRGRQYLAAPLFAPSNIPPINTNWQYVGSAAIPLNSPWELYNANPSVLSQGLVRFRKDPSGVVYFEGMLYNTANVTAASTIFTLPPGYRPSTPRYFVVNNNQPTTNNDVIVIDTLGNVLFESGASSSSSTWLSMAQVSYVAEDDPAVSVTWTPLTLQNSFTNYGSGFAPASYYIDAAGDCHLRGIIARATTPAANTTIAQLPSGAYRTDHEAIWIGAGNGAAWRMDISTTGAITFQACTTGGNTAFLSLDGIVLPLSKLTIGGGFAYTNSWVGWGAPFADARIISNRWGVCRASGLVKSGAVNTSIITPSVPQLMPAGDWVYKVISNNQCARMDVSQTLFNQFQLKLVSYQGGSNVWVSLDPMVWIPQYLNF